MRPSTRQTAGGSQIRRSQRQGEAPRCLFCGPAERIAVDRGARYPYGASSFFYLAQSSGGAAEWPAEALAAVLASDLAAFFVVAEASGEESTAFSQESVGRVRLPRWDDVGPEVQAGLRSQPADRAELNDLVYKAFSLDDSDRVLVQELLRRVGSMNRLRTTKSWMSIPLIQHFWTAADIAGE